MQPINVMIRSASVIAGLGVGISMGCLTVGPNEEHCALLDGDQTCAERYPGERTFCVRGACGPTLGRDGCVDERPEDDACYSPCGGGRSFADDPACLSGSSTSTGDESSGTEGSSGESSNGSSESSTTGPMYCVVNEDCPDVAAPLCESVGGECVTCDAFGAEADAACAGLDPANPVCLDGACVQCIAAAPEACTGMTPVCDDATNTCVPCTEHDQCGDAACNFFTGACLPSDAVVHVGPGQTYTTIGTAVSSFDMMAEGTIIVHQANYDEAVVVDGGRVLALLANAGDTPTMALIAGGAPQLTVGDGTVLLDGLRMSGNANDVGLVVDGGRAWVDRSRIVQNSNGGVLAQNAAELTLRNCFVGSLGDVIGVEIVDSSASLLYSTVTASTFGATPALGCTTPLAVEIRNSIIVSQGGASPDELSCGVASVVASATESDVGPFSAGWFVNFNGGDYHLTASGTSAFADVANWNTGDPSTDIDGAPRPTIDGTADYAGADLP